MFFLELYFVVFMKPMFYFYLSIFEMIGPNWMKNRPCQSQSPLPGLRFFSSFICFNTFLKFLSLAKASVARNSTYHNFLNNNQDMMLKKLSNSNSSSKFKKHSLPSHYHVNLFSFHTCRYLNQKRKKRSHQVELDPQK